MNTLTAPVRTPEGPPALWPTPQPVAISTREDAETAAASILANASAIARLDAQESEIRARVAIIRAELERVAAWLEGTYAPGLQSWARDHLDPGHKSVALVTGTLGFRAQAPRIEIQDEERAVAWAAEHLPAAVKIKTTVDSRALLRHAKENGEVPEGCQIIEPGEKFSISSEAK
ncbi:MAG: hypothetical protein A3E78_09240 [Alphaproteobacteria bacterium RIFCSPHIGHO2_12_FULL_63_12]|nr:MAG: hypothetical protein A3E78_09240 [Alphaproteobacteria bacterium RIFCSPHIGHO2_12_FULL_63_12]